jgi:Flp pilus assembly protein TadD
LVETSGRTEEALGEYIAVIEIDGNNVVALNNGAWYAHALSRPEALTYARRAVELAPDNSEVLDTLGWILVQQNRASEALESLAKATQLAPQDFEIRYHLGVAHAQLGQREAARATLRAMLEGGEAFEQRNAAQALLETL